MMQDAQTKTDIDRHEATANCGSSRESEYRIWESRNRALAVFLLLIVGWTLYAWRTSQSNSKALESMSRDFEIDLNLATEAELNLLPGVGTKLAQEILRYRDAQGRFDSVDDLLKIKGIKDGRILALKKHLRVYR